MTARPTHRSGLPAHLVVVLAILVALLPAGGRAQAAPAAPSSTPTPTAPAARAFVATPPAPVLVGNGALNAVSCPSRDRCVTVGSFHGNGGIRRALAEVVDHGTWSAQPLPWPDRSTTVAATAVSCPTTTLCVAVGSYRVGGVTRPLAEQFDGAGWTLLTPPAVANGSLSSISCPTATMCMAVGVTRDQPLTLRYDVTSGAWTAVPFSTLTRAVLSGVSCASPTSCLAVGHVGAFALTLVYAGVAFARATSTPPGTTIEFRAVACPAVDACVAVGGGQYGDKAFATRWDGAVWTDLAFPARRTDDWFLVGISCQDVGTCTAVDRTGGAVGLATGSWTTTAHFTGDPRGPTLAGVSCPSATTCLAVGAAPSATTLPSVARARSYAAGGWQELVVAQQAGAAPTDFAAVSCTSSSNCYAVGSWGGTQPLIEHWDGVRWSLSVTHLDLPDMRVVGLYGISCASEQACVAVGWGYPSARFGWVAVAVQLNASGWRLRPPADLGPRGDTVLSAVDCPRVNWCVAVGAGATVGTSFTAMAQVFDGRTWTVMTVPPAAGSEELLEGVSCPAVGTCVASGQQAQTFPPYPDSVDGVPVADTLDGSTWTPLAPPAQHGPLHDVSCAVAGGCVAVGGQQADPGPGRDTAAQTYTAALGFADVSSGAPGVLVAVDCSTTTSCIAVGEGSREYSAPVPQGLALGWDGSAFRVLAVPERAGTSLHDVSCAGSACAFVGQHPVDEPLAYAAVRR